MSKIGSFLPPHHDPDTCRLLVQNSLQPGSERSTDGVTVARGDGGVRVRVRCGGLLAGVWRQLLAAVSGAVVCIFAKRASEVKT